jgi:hypothetical protein
MKIINVGSSMMLLISLNFMAMAETGSISHIFLRQRVLVQRDAIIQEHQRVGFQAMISEQDKDYILHEREAARSIQEDDFVTSEPFETSNPSFSNGTTTISVTSSQTTGLSVGAIIGIVVVAVVVICVGIIYFLRRNKSNSSSSHPDKPDELKSPQDTLHNDTEDRTPSCPPSSPVFSTPYLTKHGAVPSGFNENQIHAPNPTQESDGGTSYSSSSPSSTTPSTQVYHPTPATLPTPPHTVCSNKDRYRTVNNPGEGEDIVPVVDATPVVNEPIAAVSSYTPKSRQTREDP